MSLTLCFSGVEKLWNSNKIEVGDLVELIYSGFGVVVSGGPEKMVLMLSGTCKGKFIPMINYDWWRKLSVA